TFGAVAAAPALPPLNVNAAEHTHIPAVNNTLRIYERTNMRPERFRAPLAHMRLNWHLEQLRDRGMACLSAHSRTTWRDERDRTAALPAPNGQSAATRCAATDLEVTVKRWQT